MPIPDESSLPPERSIILELFLGSLAKRIYWSAITIGRDIAVAMISRFPISMNFFIKRSSR